MKPFTVFIEGNVYRGFDTYPEAKDAFQHLAYMHHSWLVEICQLTVMDRSIPVKDIKPLEAADSR